MPKKKKEYEYSKYQLAIFDFVKNQQGNAIIEACAGSGKTFSLLKCLDFIAEDKRILLTAFNKDIVNELSNKTKDRTNVTTMTMHGLGLQMLHSNYKGKELALDEFKYRTFVSRNIKNLSTIDIHKLSRRDYIKYVDNICKYVDFGRYYLAQTIKDLDFIEDRYDIDVIEDEKAVALQVLDWGKRQLDTIDFTDMVWLPNVLMCNTYSLKYDWIFCDECQDLNRAQRELMLKCRKINTRVVCFGDSNQMLYSFAGGDPDSFDALKSLPNTISLPLSISYRCADNIVSYAKQLVSTIEENNDGRKGVVEDNADFSEVRDGDMVLCRNNAPLMKVYHTFIKEGKKCFVRGKDIGDNLKLMVRNTKQKLLNKDIGADGVFARLYGNLFDARDYLMIHSNLDKESAMHSSMVSNKLDTIKALETLSEGLTTSNELIDRISKVFSDKRKSGIELSTIHKAKGLEADRVFVVCKSLMPSKSAKKEWELRQEYNLMYVAYTRAKNSLGFLNEDDFKEFSPFSLNEKKKLAAIELKVNNVLKRKTKNISSDVEISTEIANCAKKIVLPKGNTKKLNYPAKKVQVKPTLNGFFANNKKIGGVFGNGTGLKKI